MDKTRQSSSKEPRSPQLNRVVLLKLKLENRPNGFTGKLAAKLRREAKLVLIPPSPTQSRCRIAVALQFVGEWTDEGVAEPVVSFAGEYEGRFTFSEDVPLSSIQKWLKNKFYRDSIIAQAYPVANGHMYTQLGMTGLNVRSRMLGFAPEVAEEVPNPNRLVKRALKKKSVERQ